MSAGVLSAEVSARVLGCVRGRRNIGSAARVRPGVAELAKRLPANVDGEFFVDSSCIDCDACRQIAPLSFAERGDQSAVVRQPEAPAELMAAMKALISCPTSSIGTNSRLSVRAAIDQLPEQIDDGLYRCGYTSEKSFGAISWLLTRPGGNILIDSPRFALPLVRRIEKLGGVSSILLTHRDDVADHEQFAAHFSAKRILHRDDRTSCTSGVERLIAERGPFELLPGVIMLHSPGHTKGSAVFLVDRKFLFTGDHLAWSERRGHLYAFRSACWYSWTEQIESMKRLRGLEFEWVLPGHGSPVKLPPAQMQESLESCIRWMEAV